MTSGIAITSFMPSVISSGIFSSRRANSGADALSQSNPFVAAMNMDIAGGQILNAAKGVSAIAKESTNKLATGFTSAEKSIKALTKGDKVLNGFGKVLNFTSNYINPLITVTGAVKVATADNKKEAAVREGLALGTMFASEAAAKRIIGMPIIKKIDGKRVAVAREGLYKKNPFASKQVEALKDFCNTKTFCNKSLKFLPGVLKGLVFVAASICGYQLGTAIANKILED